MSEQSDGRDESQGPSPGASPETEGEGETVGEAKWTALRELESRFPGLDKSAVEFVVISEGERGLLGIGFSPARVVARVTKAPPRPSQPAAPVTSSPSGAALAELLDRVRSALGLEAEITIEETDESISGTFQGRDLGLVIGKHGQTIDAIQYLANAVVNRSTEARIDVSVDAAGYRERRRASLESTADRVAGRVASSGASETLEPMSAAERKIVHLRLQDRDDVVTVSDGADPNRRVVVSPAT